MSHRGERGASKWRAVREMRELITPVTDELAPYQPSQRYLVIDERHLEDEDLPAGNLVTAVIGLECSRSLEDLMDVVEGLRKRLGEGEEALAREFVEWVNGLTSGLAPESEETPMAKTLEEAQMTLEERVAQWPRQWFQEGLEQGLAHERTLLRRLAPEGEETPMAKTLEEAQMTLEERVAQWPKQWFREGFEQGLAHERTLLRRQAASRFGAETAQLLAELLEGIADPERLADTGDLILHCDTGDALLAGVRALPGPSK